MLRQGTMPGQYVLQYYVDRTGRKLKGSIDLDQCEQVGKCLNLSLTDNQDFICRSTLV